MVATELTDKGRLVIQHYKLQITKI